MICSVQKVYRFTSPKSKNQQTITTFKVLAASPDTDEAKPGKNYVTRYCKAEARYPESDEAKFLTMMAAIEGIPVGPKYYAEAIEGLGLNADDYDLNTDKGVAIAEIDLEEKLNELAEAIQADEGTSRAGYGIQIDLKSGEPNEAAAAKGKKYGFCKLFPEPVIEGWVVNGELSEEAVDVLRGEDWKIIGDE